MGDEITGEQVGCVDYESVDSEDGESSAEDIKEMHGRDGDEVRVGAGDGCISVERFK